VRNSCVDGTEVECRCAHCPGALSIILLPAQHHKLLDVDVECK
jgi:hypothetical protein